MSSHIHMLGRRGRELGSSLVLRTAATLLDCGRGAMLLAALSCWANFPEVAWGALIERASEL